MAVMFLQRAFVKVSWKMLGYQWPPAFTIQKLQILTGTAYEEHLGIR
jgi:hypothetical protein